MVQTENDFTAPAPESCKLTLTLPEEIIISPPWDSEVEIHVEVEVFFFFNPACANTCLRQLSSQHMMRQRVACLNLVQSIDTEHWIKKRAECLSNQAKKQNLMLVICTSTGMTLRWRWPRKHTRCKTFVFFLSPFLAMSTDYSTGAVRGCLHTFPHAHSAFSQVARARYNRSFSGCLCISSRL